MIRNRPYFPSGLISSENRGKGKGKGYTDREYSLGINLQRQVLQRIFFAEEAKMPYFDLATSRLNFVEIMW